MTPHRVVIVAFPPAQLLDITGPLDALTSANVAALQAGLPSFYEVVIATPYGERILTTSGVSIDVSCDIFDPDLTVDTLMVAGGPGARCVQTQPSLVTVLSQLCDRTPRVASICTGAFALAATGELDNRRATTHWAHFDEFARDFPLVSIERDALFITDGKYSTSAGVTAGIDYTLAMIEHDLGRRIALQVARDLVVFLKRPGGQSQFSAHLAAEIKAENADPFTALNCWMEDNLSSELSVSMMADRVAMSPRNFARRFKQAMNVTPNAHLQTLRVDAARSLLSDSSIPIPRIAKRCGFSSTAALKSAFTTRVHVSPEQFRARFQSAGFPLRAPAVRGAKAAAERRIK
jgi:transcriptional regulator GlxA family with amidase domain